TVIRTCSRLIQQMAPRVRSHSPLNTINAMIVSRLQRVCLVVFQLNTPVWVETRISPRALQPSDSIEKSFGTWFGETISPTDLFRPMGQENQFRLMNSSCSVVRIACVATIGTPLAVRRNPKESLIKRPRRVI